MAETERIHLSRMICNAEKISMVVIDTNLLTDIYRIAHDAVITYLVSACVMALQKLFSVYYISSGLSLAEFGVDAYVSPRYDLLCAYCFGTENMEFYVIGSEVTRLQKVKSIADDEVVQKYLNVCVKPLPDQKNCSRCAKCTRTMLELYVNGDLDKFSKTFDTKAFYQDPNYYFGYMYLKGKNAWFIQDIFEKMKAEKIKMPRGARIAGLRKLIKNGFKRKNPLATEYRP